MGNQTVRIDIEKNRLVVISNGFFTDEEIDKGCNRILDEMAKLKPGFIGIFDVTNFKPATAYGAQKLQELSAQITKSGAKKIINIVSANQMTNLQVTRIARSEINDLVVHVNTIEEAEKLADTF